MIKKFFQLYTITYSRILILSLIFGLIACNQAEPEKGSSALKSNPLDVLNKEFKSVLENQVDSSFLLDFYKNSGEQLLWLNDNLDLNDRGKLLYSMITHVNDYGLNNKQYPSFVNIDSLNGIAKDTALTSCFIQFIKELRWGLLPNEYFVSPFPVSERNEKEFISSITEIINTTDFQQLIYQCQPNHSQYHSLVVGLKTFNNRVLDVNKKYAVPSYKKDSLLAYSKAAEVLFNYGLIDSLLVVDSVLINALKEFQQEHGLNADGVIGSNTAKALSKSPYDYFLNASLALEKWRKREDWAKDRIAINIAGFHLKYFQDDQTTRMHRVVVGTRSNKTIEILDSLEYLVIYPFWYVPYSIISNELLPKARKDSSYLRRNGYELLSGGKTVNSELIDYNAGFKYTVRQKGGRSNALGLIKFIFPNPSYIYLHDTPSKKLFNREMRTFSHGCIRLENPLDLAKDLLIRDNNQYNIDSVERLIKDRVRTKVYLNKKLPIYIHYTLASTKDNNIVFHNDVYGRDEKILVELKKKLE